MMNANLHSCALSATALLAAMFCALDASAQVTSPPPGVSQPDLTSDQLDWNRHGQFYWPDHAWNRDPWWSMAKTLASASLRDDMKHDPRNKAVLSSADTWNRRLLKVLMPQVTQESETFAYISSSGSQYAELTMAKFRNGLSFEIRQSLWVWTFWFPKDTPGSSPTMDEVRAVLPEAYRTKWVPVTEKGFPRGTLRLAADDQPPYFRDMLLFETEAGVILCGSKIMGGIAMMPAHGQFYDFTKPPQQRRLQQAW